LCSYSGMKFKARSLVAMTRRVVVPALRRNCGPAPWRLLCDGDGAFRSTLFLELCHQVGIILVPHPGNSPDLNPDENAWSEGDRFVERAVFESAKWRKGAAGTGKQVSQADKDEWDEFVKTEFRKITPQFILNCTTQKEMVSRLEEVVAKDGRRIKK
jgi:hypothetical protein